MLFLNLDIELEYTAIFYYFLKGIFSIICVTLLLLIYLYFINGLFFYGMLKSLTFKAECI
jgi:hypothetical protein